MKFKIRPLGIVICTAYLLLAACQSSSQSSQSSPSMPMPSSSSQSSSSSRSMPSSSSQSSSSSRSLPSPSSQSSSVPSNPGPSSSSSQARSASRGDQGQPSPAGTQKDPATASPGQQSQPVGDALPAAGGGAAMPSGDNRRGAQPGDDRIESSGGRDISTGDVIEKSGINSPNIPNKSGQSGDYSLDTLPNGVLSGSNQTQGRGPMTASERARVLDERLRKGYETFDGFILSEREKAQNESNAAGSAQPGADGGGGNAQYQPQTIQEAAGDPSGVSGAPPSPSASREVAENFPAPDDIPSGRDDDVVARQLREAAMREPDPELREALWDEYRNYTGLSGGTDQ